MDRELYHAQLDIGILELKPTYVGQRNIWPSQYIIYGPWVS